MINKTFGYICFVYNRILYIANKIYEETGKNKIITPASLKSENQFFEGSGQSGTFKCSIKCKIIVYEFFQNSNLKRIMLKVIRQIVWIIRYKLKKINIWFWQN
ncbi:hypothetical protein AB8B28_07530 [Leptotrichia sp. HSP-536]|uniref:Transposase putative helix-turn-helix domain-containing protein n=1 Tax=Leptotrichia alba TaxID=3239304 RepID=A0AB39V2G7_9FUSO